MKECARCGELRPVSMFHKNGLGRKVLKVCGNCITARKAERRIERWQQYKYSSIRVEVTEE